MPAGASEDVEHFLYTHEYLFRQQTARFYPLPFALIEQYADWWDFNLLSQNPGVPWDLHTLGLFGHRVDWTALSINTGITWTDAMLDRYREKLNWQELCRNPSFPFTGGVLEKYAGDVDWIYLSANPALPLTDAFLDSYGDRIHWPILKSSNRNPEQVGARFRERLDAVPDTFRGAVFPLPDLTKHYIRWDLRNGNLPLELSRVLEQPVSGVQEDLFETCQEYWEWSHISACIHLAWSISFFERFYRHLDWTVTLNPGFYARVLKPELTDERIGKVCARLNPENVVPFYSLEEKKDEFGMLPNVQAKLPGVPGNDDYRRVNAPWEAIFSGQHPDMPIPEVIFELSWYLRHPIRFADYHQWSYENRYPAIVVSEKMKQVMERFTLPPHRFYRIELAIGDPVFGADTRDYFIFHAPEQDYLYYDYEKTVFVEDEDRVQQPNRGPQHHKPYCDASYYTRQIAAPYPAPITSPQDYLAAKAELAVRNPLKRLRPRAYIWTADFDVISSRAENPRRSIWISENLRKAMEIAGLEGVRFERVTETRPRMTGLEKPECRIKNEAILEAMRAEFLHAPPPPEQITVRNFRAAEAWADTVRRNKGIVKKMFDDHPAYATNDEFLQKIREKEIEFDVVFPGWFVRLLKSGKLPSLFKDFTLKPLEHLYCQQLADDLPLTVKSVIFAEYSTSVLFLTLKRDSLYELDDAIWRHEFDQGPPPWIETYMDKNGRPVKK